jgi:hypothetical protein
MNLKQKFYSKITIAHKRKFKTFLPFDDNELLMQGI